jgi:hypothetical protein
LLSVRRENKANAKKDYQKVSQHEVILNEDCGKKLPGNMLSNHQALPRISKAVELTHGKFDAGVWIADAAF